MNTFITFYRYIREILLTSDTRPAVILSIISAYIWGFTIILPPPILFRPYYFGLNIITSNEIVWGLLFIFLATVQLIRLFPTKKLPKYVLFEYIVRLFSCCLWTYIVFTAGAQIPVPPVVGDTVCIMLAAWWDFMRYQGYHSEIIYRKFHKKEE